MEKITCVEKPLDCLHCDMCNRYTGACKLNPESYYYKTMEEQYTQCPIVSVEYIKENINEKN